MRFAYIDSQGNEVSIPSVDALALRIELGAIGPKTELYDAQSDRWGAAESHEIYHTLARDVGGEDFLIPTPPPPGDTGPSEPEPPPAPAEEAPPEDATGAIVPPPPESERAAATAEDLGLTLAPLDDAEDEPDEVVAPEELAPDWGDEDVAFGEPLSEADAVESTPPDFALEIDEPAASQDDDDLGLEPALDFGGGSEDDFGSGLDLEPPMSDFDPSAPPAWMEQEGPPANDGESLMDFSAGLDEAGAGPEGGAVPGKDPDEARPRPTPRPNRPPPRRPAPRRSFAKPLLSVLLLGAVGYGAWLRLAAVR